MPDANNAGDMAVTNFDDDASVGSLGTWDSAGGWSYESHRSISSVRSDGTAASFMDIIGHIIHSNEPTPWGNDMTVSRVAALNDSQLSSLVTHVTKQMGHLAPDKRVADLMEDAVPTRKSIIIWANETLLKIATSEKEFRDAEERARLAEEEELNKEANAAAAKIAIAEAERAAVIHTVELQSRLRASKEVRQAEDDRLLHQRVNLRHNQRTQRNLATRWAIAAAVCFGVALLNLTSVAATNAELGYALGSLFTIAGGALLLTAFKTSFYIQKFLSEEELEEMIERRADDLIAKWDLADQKARDDEEKKIARQKAELKEKKRLAKEAKRNEERIRKRDLMMKMDSIKAQKTLEAAELAGALKAVREEEEKEEEATAVDPKSTDPNYVDAVDKNGNHYVKKMRWGDNHPNKKTGLTGHAFNDHHGGGHYHGHAVVNSMTNAHDERLKRNTLHRDAVSDTTHKYIPAAHAPVPMPYHHNGRAKAPKTSKADAHVVPAADATPELHEQEMGEEARRALADARAHPAHHSPTHKSQLGDVQVEELDDVL
mmetsp:Transcript_62963/g.172565  ORF Transcript_62963/g.172565 Transcript_62963/m.172565 type:complete len:545 (-) Transcript_62963:681-2315(-)